MATSNKKINPDWEESLERAIHSLWRNHPEWPSTFGPCPTPGCGGSGRGSGQCARCVTAYIADIVGDYDAAQNLNRAIEEVRSATEKLRELVRQKAEEALNNPKP